MSENKLPWKIKKYKARFVALSPIHIGTGEVLPACRYVLPPEGQDQGWCLKESFSAGLLAEGRISIKDYMEKPLSLDMPILKRGVDDGNFLYPISFTKAAREKLKKEVKPFVRDGFGRAYLPGSSIKGMLRTALAFSFLMNEEQARKNLLKQLDQLEPKGLIEKMNNVSPKNIKEIRKKNAARVSLVENLFRPLEKEKTDPKYDILRAVKVSDSEPIDTPLVVAAVNIFTSKGSRIEPLSSDTPPTFCEVVDPGTEICFEITLDEGLLVKLGESNPSKIRIKNHYDLLSALQDHARVMVNIEKSFLEKNGVNDVWDKEYEQGEDADYAIVRLGWGSGWTGSSLFPILSCDDPEKETPKRPLSRKIVISSKGEPRAMLGWGKLYIEEIPE
ncbi:CRISPR-associated RAMP protein, Csm5 family [Thermovirga lienii DSM 17291]|uniref:CRISPR system Cms protein Csm5 n=1 Tax=Thermovirga lienii (strain ATCC BAA-1197 / DSM 17291 / Cas60314) TaxID=580340 RepID=G7V6F0_THELD|nr:type III-A CRISPR-associated RAMP protein Csm5 [Thermovirga lienii]AER65979.1 CRISPR-associated RAMP protein, Csm5 family [Thermovirga lienii DSM 17291]